jgi:hypothetical protein
VVDIVVSAPIRAGAVKTLHSIIGVAQMAILQWVLFAQTLGVRYELLVDARALVTFLDQWCTEHPPDGE